MPVFKRLGPGDQIDNVLVLEPKWTLASGSGGWRGSPEGSASLNLYGGAHRRPGGVVREYQYEPTIPYLQTYGKLHRSWPLTSSVSIAWMTDEDLDLTQRSRTRWGREHHKTVMRLYDYYSRRDPDYTTASYDHYCLYFNSGSQNIVTVYDGLSVGPNRFRYLPTGSFTFEAWFKPFTVGDADHDLTILSRARTYRLAIDGSTARLVWAVHSGSSLPVVALTGSDTVTPRQWHHVAVTMDRSTMSGTLYLDLKEQGTYAFGALVEPIGYTGSFHVGGEWGGTVTSGTEDPLDSAKGAIGTTFHGFIGQVRVWGECRSLAQISASYDRRLVGSDLGPPLLGDITLSDGPFSTAPAVDPSGLAVNYLAPVVGSGVLDRAAQHQGISPDFGALYSFDDRPGPGWHPNDNPSFIVPKVLNPDRIGRMWVLHVPSAFYGRQIQPGSVRIIDNAFNSPEFGLTRVLVDDGRGGLFLSGSACSGSTEGPGVGWNKVGNVMYEDGLVIVRDPTLLDIGASWGDSTTPNDLIQIEFKGQSRVPVKTVVARIDRGDLNRSLNPTYYRTEEDGFRSIRHPSGNLYITTVGLYNSDRELVGVARLAEPLRVRPRDRLAVKIRLDF